MGKPLTQVPTQRAGNFPGDSKSVDTARNLPDGNSYDQDQL